MRLSIIVRLAVLASSVCLIAESFASSSTGSARQRFPWRSSGRSRLICCSGISTTAPVALNWRRPATSPSSSSRTRPPASIPATTSKTSNGRAWSVKLGVEAQSEVTASRILWAMGFHQPPTYYVEQWTLEGTDAGVKNDARFRADIDAYKPTDEWAWNKNPFVDTQAFRGLIVAQMILNSWDLKTANNRVYEADRSVCVAAPLVHGARRRLVTGPLEAETILCDARRSRAARAARTTSKGSSGRVSSRRSAAIASSSTTAACTASC